MPLLLARHRYSPPSAGAASNLHKTLANSKITKMQPNNSRPSRSALRRTPPRGPRNQLQGAQSYRQSYTPSIQNHFSNYASSNRSYGGTQEEEECGGQGDYGFHDYAGGQLGGGSWAAQPEWYGRQDYGGYEGYQYTGYGSYQYCDYGYYGDVTRQPENAVQSSLTQQNHFYPAAQSFASDGQQHPSQGAYYQDLRSATPARQGYRQDYADTNYLGHRGAYRPTAHRQQDDSYSPTYPSTPVRQRQQEMYVRGSPVYEWPASSGFQRSHGPTQSDNSAGNSNANASNFQPQTANRVPPTPINFIPSPTAQQGARFSPTSKAKPKKDEHPHLHVLKRPRPSADYLAQASQDWQTLDTEKPRQLLVVLDLNGTLLHRKVRGGSSFASRPKVKEFLQYLLKNHKVMVWSSAKPENVKGMCKQLFTKDELEKKLVAVWARDTLRLPAYAYSSKVQVYKQLSWVWENEAIETHHSDLMDGGWDQSNTVLIDDSVEKGASEPHNLVCLEEFENRQDQQRSDVLGQVVKYLEVLKWERDVSAYIESLPFKYVEEERFDWDGVA